MHTNKDKRETPIAKEKCKLYHEQGLANYCLAKISNNLVTAGKYGHFSKKDTQVLTATR